MSATLERLNTWLAAPSETEHLEFKEAKAQYSSAKLFKYCVVLPTRQADKASRIIRDTMDEGLIKLEDPQSSSKRYAKYIPYWA